MADPEQREQESRESDRTKYDERLEAEERERAGAAEQVRRERPLEERDED